MKIELYPKTPLSQLNLPKNKDLEVVFGYDQSIEWLVSSQYIQYQFLQALGTYTLGKHTVQIRAFNVNTAANTLTFTVKISGSPALVILGILIKILPYVAVAGLIITGVMALKQINLLVENLGSQILNTPFGIIAVVAISLYLIYIIFIKKK
ncbi:MAG: hypothetical protein KG012_03335 [Deltaproteobacteria bacterium]|nr:hypothetical protein [Deltaproteobacteria bacterium]